MLRTIVTAAILALAVNTAQADTSSQVSVAFGDLNLSNPSDAKTMADRLQAAAKTVCLQAGAQSHMQQCMDYAINTAMARIEDRLDKSVRTHLAGDSQPMENP